jgi:hypothetical protein
MRRWLWVGVIGVGFLVSACAGPGEAPKTADMLFPMPYLLKTHGSGKAPTPAPDGVEAR